MNVIKSIILYSKLPSKPANTKLLVDPKRIVCGFLMYFFFINQFMFFF